MVEEDNAASGSNVRRRVMTCALMAAKLEEEAASTLRFGFSVFLFLRKGYERRC